MLPYNLNNIHSEIHDPFSVIMVRDCGENNAFFVVMKAQITTLSPLFDGVDGSVYSKQTHVYRNASE